MRDLARDFFRKSEHVHLNIGSAELSANHNIRQIVKIVDRRDKNQEVVEFVQRFYEEEADSKRDKVSVAVIRDVFFCWSCDF